LVFFSLSQSKLPSYILPAFPALAIIIAVEIERAWNGEKDRLLTASRWLTAAALVLFGVAFLIYLNRESLFSTAWNFAVGCAPLVVALFVFAMIVTGKSRAAMVGAVATVSCLAVAASLVILPHIDGQLGLKQLSLDIRAALKPEEKMAFYMNKNYAPVFYAEGRAISSPGLGEGLNAYLMEELVSSLEAEKSLIVITTSNYERDITDNPDFHAELIARQGTHCAYRVVLASPPQ
jgi:4-amino-4-deoxy-L-arabinose transferase-like glycosyltransferase